MILCAPCLSRGYLVVLHLVHLRQWVGPVRECLVDVIAMTSPQALVSSSGEDSEQHFRRITQMTILTIELIVEFSKCLTGFDSLLKDDQILLLKVPPPSRATEFV